MCQVIIVAVHAQGSRGEEIVVGAICVLLGSLLLFFHRRLRTQYQAMTRDNSPVVFVSTYLVPTVFVVVGVAAIVVGGAAIARGA